MSLRARIDRFNRRHPWSHNDFYGPWVAGQVGAARRVLDIGCGTGNLIDRLRNGNRQITGLEPDPRVAELAAARFAGDPAVVIEQTRFDPARTTGAWDAITMVASLHHLPLPETLRAVDRCLAPGGRLVVVGCFRESGPADGAIGLIALVANLARGLRAHPRGVDRPPVAMTAPVAAPRETLAEIRAAAAESLPGARLRRRLFWRYALVYDKPVSGRRPPE
ncbi:class I SAM-dependent methyltransferase [Nocardia sp. NPDC048505]|uniref:class I SAM-dependent methyltransferase n=1 Tax=unclassified Nocardia TaxID=2637762 RepID=UPI0033C4004F